MVNDSGCVVQCYGMTKEPETNNFIMVMHYAPNGSLRQNLNNNFNKLSWIDKLNNLREIAGGLAVIHDKGLIHHDFHCGNILSWHTRYTYITDLGLCKPANEKSKKQEKCIYGVLPYVAPEVLRGKEYTQASDIYGYGIIAYEVCTGYPPYHDVEHDEILAIKICTGQRPKSKYKIPQLILDIIKKCWDANTLKRPKAKKLETLFQDLWYSGKQENSTIYKQIFEASEINKNLSSSLTGTLPYATHPQAVYTSRLLDYKNLPEPKNNDNDDSFEIMYSGE